MINFNREYFSSYLYIISLSWSKISIINWFLFVFSILFFDNLMKCLNFVFILQNLNENKYVALIQLFHL